MAHENFDWVRGSLALLEAFAAHGGARSITAGSCAEYDWHFGYCVETVTPCRPRTAYGVCKHALQELSAAFAATAGISSAWGRLFFLYGPHEHPDRLVPSVARALLAHELARCTHGTQVRDYLHVADAAAALVALLESEAIGPVNIASGIPVSVKTIVTQIAEALDGQHRLQLGALPTPADDPPLLVADVRRLTHEVGWSPVYDLGMGLEETIRWWRERESAA
jgi:nucleoside-diphosphate-sugar epimerase